MVDVSAMDPGGVGGPHATGSHSPRFNKDWKNPSGNDHIWHRKGKGKSSSKVPLGEVYIYTC